MGEWEKAPVHPLPCMTVHHGRTPPFHLFPFDYSLIHHPSRTIHEMAKDEGDIRATKAARAEMAKRGIDMTLADMRCMHGILHIRGTVRPYRGIHVADMKSEMEMIARVLRQKSDIRDVSLECLYRG